MSVDWVGGNASVFNCLAASNHSDVNREQNDYYATDPKSLEQFLVELDKTDIKLNKNIWEPACGEGHISKVLINKGYNVLSTDLIDRGFGKGNVDFLQTKDKLTNTDILTNPPYKFAEEFVYKALDILDTCSHCVMYLKIQFLEGKSRYNLFQKYPPKFIFVHSTRQVCALNGEFIKDGKQIGSAVCYAWYVWEKGYNGDTIVKWIK